MITHLIRLNLRLNRTMIIWWSLGLWAFLALTPPAYLRYYPTLADREGLVDGMRDNMGTRAMYGIFPKPGTIGQFTTWETGAWMMVLAAAMAVLLITAMHRGAEAKGEAELIQSAGLPRSKIILAALVASHLVALMVGVVSILILIALHYLSTDEISLEGAVTYGLMTTVIMSAFIGLTSILQALWGNPINLARLGLLAVAVSFLVRMFADAYDAVSATVFNWISPLGWRAQIMPFTDDDWSALAIAAGIAVALTLIALALDTRRSFNSSLIPQRASRERAPRRIRGLLSLNLLTHRGAVVAWSVTTGVIILSMLPLVDSLIPLIEQNDSTLNVLQQLMPAEDLQSEFIVYIFQMVAVMVSVAVVQPLVTYVGQERIRLVDAMRAVGTPRWAPLWGAVATALLTGVACTVLGILGGFIALRLQDGEVVDGHALVLASGGSMFLQTIIFTGIVTALAGWFPRAIHLAWLPVVTAGVVSILGPLFELTPEQIDLSPLSHTATPSGDNLGTLAIFAGLGALGIILGLIGAQRREIR